MKKKTLLRNRSRKTLILSLAGLAGCCAPPQPSAVQEQGTGIFEISPPGDDSVTLLGGELQLGAKATPIPGDLIVDAGIVTSTASHQLASTSNVTLNGGIWNLNGKSEEIQSFTNLAGTMLFSGGNLQTRGNVFLAGGVTIVASTLGSGRIVFVAGGDNEVHANSSVTAGTLLDFTGADPAMQVFSDSQHPGKVIVSANGGISFLGTGTARLDSVGSAALPGLLDLDASDKHTISVRPGSTLAISPQIVNGGFSVNGGGTLELKSANSLTGGVTVRDSSTTVVADDALALGSAGSTVTLDGGSLSLRNNAPSTGFPINLQPASSGESTNISIDRVTGAGSAGIFTVNNLALGSGNAGFTLDGPHGGTLTAKNVTLQYHNSGPGPCNLHTAANLLIDGPIQASGGAVDLVKDQNGILTLSGSTNNSFGSLTVGGGTLALNKSGNAVAVPGDLRIRSGAVVQLSSSSQIVPTSMLTLDGSTGATVDLNGCNNTFGSGAVGGLTFLAGGMMKTGAGTATLGGDVSFTGVSGTAKLYGQIDLGSATHTFDIARGNAAVSDMEIDAVISGGNTAHPATLIKTGPGILYLRGKNTFVGTILLKQGIVKIDSDDNLGQPPNPVIVSAGAVLQH